jgi:hypothetical protein
MFLGLILGNNCTFGDMCPRLFQHERSAVSNTAGFCCGPRVALQPPSRDHAIAESTAR